MSDIGDLIDNLRDVFDGEFGDDIYVIVGLPEAFIQHLPNLEESKWHSKGTLRYRIDPPNPSLQMQRHIHITNKKHVASKSNQVAWNQDGSRRDKSSFNTSMKGMEKAKRLARDVLGLSQDIVLESCDLPESLKESVDQYSRVSQVYALRIMA
jgi:hypothetical protein